MWIFVPLGNPIDFYFLVYLYKILITGCQLWGYQPSAFENLLLNAKIMFHHPGEICACLSSRGCQDLWSMDSKLVLLRGSVAWLKIAIHSLIQSIFTKLLQYWLVVDDEWIFAEIMRDNLYGSRIPSQTWQSGGDRHQMITQKNIKL